MQLKASCPECKKIVKVKRDGGLYKHECDDYVETPAHVISPSGFNTYNFCAFKFWLGYGPLKVKEPPTKHTLRGTLVHKVCEDLWEFKFQVPDNWRQQLKTQAKELFDERWGRYKSLHREGEQFKTETWTMVQNHVETVTRQVEGQLGATPHFGVKGCWTIVKPKIEENYFLKEHGMRGRVDEIIELDDEVFFSKFNVGPDNEPVEEPDKVIISDLKTSKVYKVAFSEDYETQIHFYALLYWLVNKRYPAYGCIKWLRYGTETYFKIDPELVRSIHQRVKDLQELIHEHIDDQTKFPPNTDGKFCAWCTHGMATYDGQGNIVKKPFCKAGWEKHSEDGEQPHGYIGTVKYIKGNRKEE